MQKQNDQEQKKVPNKVKFVHNLLSATHPVEVENAKNHTAFLKDALVDLLDHDAFEDTTFRSQFSAAIAYFELQASIYDGYTKKEITKGVAWAKNLIESEVRHA